MMEVADCNEAQSSRLSFFLNMERHIRQSFTVSSIVDSTDESDELDQEEYEIANQYVLRRNSFDIRQLSDNQPTQLDDKVVRPKSALSQDNVSVEDTINPACDMGHLSRRVWIGTNVRDEADGNHEKSFGFRRLFNRGNNIRVVGSHSGDEDDWTNEWSGGKFDSRTRGNQESSVKQKMTPYFPCASIIVSPYMVSKFIADMIVDVLRNGIVYSNEACLYSRPRHSESLPSGLPYYNEDVANSMVETLTAEDYEMFRGRNNGAPLGSKVEPAEVVEFVNAICSQSQMEYECAVLSFLYLERVMRQSKGVFTLDGGNWKGLVLACMVMSNKVWDDFHMLNVGYTTIFPSLTLQRINELELQLLRVLNANLWVGVGEYAAYHFRVQAHFAQAEIDKVSNHMAQGLVKRASFHERKRPKRTRVICATSTDEERTLVIACGSDQSSLSTSNTNRVGSAAVQTSYPGDSEEGEEVETKLSRGCFSAARRVWRRVFVRRNTAKVMDGPHRPHDFSNTLRGGCAPPQQLCLSIRTIWKHMLTE